MSSYKSVIKNHFENRIKKNSRYSLRAYARDLDIPASRLSDILNAKSGLSLVNAEKIAKNLNLSQKEKELFLNQVLAAHGRSDKTRKIAKKYIAETKEKDLGFSEIDLDTFKIISDWYHYAILDLVETYSFTEDSKWISDRLNVSKFQVDQALGRLKKLNLLEAKKDKIKSLNKTIATPSDIPSQAIKDFHRQILEKAIEAIDFQSVEERDITTITIPLDLTLMKELKRKIKNFRRDINNWVKSHNLRPEEVYCLNFNLFRLTKKYKEGEKV